MRLFLKNIHGCRYLATICGLITGSATAYVPEIGVSIHSLQKDLRHLVRRYTEDDRRGIPNEGRIILRTENTPPEVYTTDVISGILRAEGKGIFDSRTAVLGHLQQGGIPSPSDRIRATRLAVHCMDWIQKAALDSMVTRSSRTSKKGDVYTVNPDHACVIGVRGGAILFTPVETLVDEIDMKSRRSKSTWWMDLNNMTRMLAKYDYHEESDVDFDDSK